MSESEHSRFVTANCPVEGCGYDVWIDVLRTPKISHSRFDVRYWQPAVITLGSSFADHWKLAHGDNQGQEG